MTHHSMFSAAMTRVHSHGQEKSIFRKLFLNAKHVASQVLYVAAQSVPKCVIRGTSASKLRESGFICGWFAFVFDFCSLVDYMTVWCAFFGF